MRRVLLAAPLAAVLLASPSPAAAQPWVVAPASDGAEVISQLFWFTLVLATIVFVLVEGLLIYSSLRFRRRAPLPLHEPPQIHGNTRLEVMWATVPALILIGLFGITVSRLGDLSQMPTDPNTLHISVTGQPVPVGVRLRRSGVKTTNDLHIPGRHAAHLRRDVDGRDPQLLGARPVRQDRREPGPDQSHHLQGHPRGHVSRRVRRAVRRWPRGMLFRVEAVSQTEFQQWLQSSSKPAQRRR